MKFSKGDLIALKNNEDKRITAIIISIFNNSQFFYCYCLDTGKYRLVYEKEIEFIIAKEFDPKFPVDEDLFNIDYSFYGAVAREFSFSPFCSFPYSFDDFDDLSTLSGSSRV